MSSLFSFRRLRLSFFLALVAVITLVSLADTADAAQRRRQPTRQSGGQTQAGYCDIASRCASILIDGQTGTVLRGESFDKQVYPASVTKLMTLYLMFEAIETGRFTLSDRLVISPHAAAADPTKIGLSPGSTITVEDAIEAVAVKSANDIAIAIAEAVSGNESAFARRMNQKAAEIGMSQTTFRNASGLPDTGQVTTARDMARLAQRLLRTFPSYKRYLGLTSAQVAGRRIEGHNRLLKSGDCTGGKTGFIRASGYNLVAWNERNGRQVIAAVFGGSSISARAHQVAELLRAGMGVIPSAPTQQITEASLNAATTWVPAEMPKPRPGTETTSTPPPNGAEDTEADEAAPPPVSTTSSPALPEGVVNVAADSFKLPGNSFMASWAIQVGAYRDAAQAQRALAQATRTLPVLLGAALPRTLATTTTMGQLHRAQLIGLDETAAKSACATLSQQGMQCLAMPPGQTS